MSAGRVLLLGADGFIGRHIAFALRRAGWQVIACARRPRRLAQMGFQTVKADLTDPATHDPAFWADPLHEVQAVINAAGLLSASEPQFHAVHQAAPQALYQAMPEGCGGVLISAVGIDAADTPFARHRRAGEDVARQHGITILRPGLVLGETSYGGSSLLRALAAAPLMTPIVGDGHQPFNPIHADDLAQALIPLLLAPRATSEPYVIGGPETLTQAELIAAYRSWLGLRPVPSLPLPVPLARAVGAIGDLMRLGPISRSAVDQLSAGVLAPPDPRLSQAARGISQVLADRPAGTQDLWHARLYLLRPLSRGALIVLWLVSGLLGLFLPPDTFLPLLPDSTLSDSLLVGLARIGGLADLAIALALLRGWRLRLMAGVQVALIGAYTVTFTVLAPGLWLLPLGGLLKNLPLLVLIALHAVLEEER